jgi:hypothetical protein
MKLKSIANIALASALALTTVVATTSAANAAVWQPTAASQLDSTSFSVTAEDNFASTQGYSTLYNDANDALCITLGQGSCAAATTGSFSGTYILPVCENAAQILCIDAVNIYKQGSSAQAATLIRQVSAPTTAVAAGSKLPKGGATTLWNAPSAPNAAGETTYAVSIEADVAINKGVVSSKSFTATVKPYSLKVDSYAKASKIVGSGSNAFIADFSDSKCAFTEESICGELQDFSLDTRVGLTFRIGKSPNTFYSGRVKSPVLSIANAATAGYQKVSLNAQPVMVQGLSQKFALNNAPAGLDVGGAPRAKTDYALSSTADVNALRSATGNKASGARSYWSFNNQDETMVNLGVATKCTAATGVKGIVATDALIADAFNPVKVGTTVKQTINSFGLNADGSQALGSWDLVLANDYARCAFGLAKTGAIKVKPTALAAAKGPGFSATGTSTSAWATVAVRNIKFAGANTLSVAITK